ncbi:MAG: hypothetical protein WBF35_08370 [Candidatus Acidiferrales bacterium]
MASDILADLNGSGDGSVASISETYLPVCQYAVDGGLTTHVGIAGPQNPPSATPTWTTLDSADTTGYQTTVEFQSGYIVPFPGPGGKYQISQNGGWAVRWDKNNHLYYLTMGGRLMKADVSASAESLQVKTLRPLFEVSVPSFNSPFFDVTSDGSRFLVITSADPTASRSITVLLNWQAALKNQ